MGDSCGKGFQNVPRMAAAMKPQNHLGIRMSLPVFLQEFRKVIGAAAKYEGRINHPLKRIPVVEGFF